MRPLTRLFVLTLTLALLAPTPALAHPLSPAHLVLDLHDAHVDLTLTVARDSVEPTLIPPPACAVEPGPLEVTDESVTHRQRWRCAPSGALTLSPNPGDPPVLVELRRDGHPLHTTLLDASSPRLDLAAAAPSTLAMLGTWVWLGATHLIEGLDHVLLVIGLLLLIGWSLKLLWALTAFTLGHSISLALGATGLLTLPSALVETAIALTLIMLALDLVAPHLPHPHPSSSSSSPTPSPANSLFVRAPWVTGLLVGLIHGLGFAGVLTELGLPEHGLALALIGFNIGLELGQLGLALAALALTALVRAARPLRAPSHAHALAPSRTHALAGWAIGALGAAWVFERALGL